MEKLSREHSDSDIVPTVSIEMAEDDENQKDDSNSNLFRRQLAAYLALIVSTLSGSLYYVLISGDSDEKEPEARSEQADTDAENILDYGAKPNPTDPDLASARRNVEAIWEAAREAGPHGALYIPEGIYYIGQDQHNRIIDVGQDLPAGISWYGDGPDQSALALTEHMDKDDSSHVLIYYGGENTDHGTVEIENLGFYGNARNLDGLKSTGTSRSSNCIRLDDKSISGTFECQNVLWQDWHDLAVRTRGEFDFIADRCTFWEVGAESRKKNESGHQLSLGANATLTNCQFRRAGSYILNYSDGDGDLYMENCYVKGYGTGLIKMSSGDTMEIRNAYVEANTPWIEEEYPDRTDPEEEFKGKHFLYTQLDDNGVKKTALLRDVEFRNCTQSGIRDRRGQILDADNVAIHNANSEGVGNGVMSVESDGDLEFCMSDQKISIHDSQGCPIDCDSGSSAHGTIGTLRRDENKNHVGECNADNVTISTDLHGFSPLVPDTPEEDETGITNNNPPLYR